MVNMWFTILHCPLGNYVNVVYDIALYNYCNIFFYVNLCKIFHKRNVVYDMLWSNVVYDTAQGSCGARYVFVF